MGDSTEVAKQLFSLDDVSMQLFEGNQFYYPLATQKDARAFVKALAGKGYALRDLCSEIGEAEQNFTAWRKGLGRPGVGLSVIERINRPYRLILSGECSNTDHSQWLSAPINYKLSLRIPSQPPASTPANDPSTPKSPKPKPPVKPRRFSGVKIESISSARLLRSASKDETDSKHGPQQVIAKTDNASKLRRAPSAAAATSSGHSSTSLKRSQSERVTPASTSSEQEQPAVIAEPSFTTRDRVRMFERQQSPGSKQPQFPREEPSRRSHESSPTVIAESCRDDSEEPVVCVSTKERVRLFEQQKSANNNNNNNNNNVSNNNNDAEVISGGVSAKSRVQLFEQRQNSTTSNVKKVATSNNVNNNVKVDVESLTQLHKAAVQAEVDVPENGEHSNQVADVGQREDTAATIDMNEQSVEANQNQHNSSIEATSEVEYMIEKPICDETLEEIHTPSLCVQQHDTAAVACNETTSESNGAIEEDSFVDTKPGSADILTSDGGNSNSQQLSVVTVGVDILASDSVAVVTEDNKNISDDLRDLELLNGNASQSVHEEPNHQEEVVTELPVFDDIVDGVTTPTPTDLNVECHPMPHEEVETVDIVSTAAAAIASEQQSDLKERSSVPVLTVTDDNAGVMSTNNITDTDDSNYGDKTPAHSQPMPVTDDSAGVMSTNNITDTDDSNYGDRTPAHSQPMPVTDDSAGTLAHNQLMLVTDDNAGTLAHSQLMPVTIASPLLSVSSDIGSSVSSDCFSDNDTLGVSDNEPVTPRVANGRGVLKNKHQPRKPKSVSWAEPEVAGVVQIERQPSEDNEVDIATQLGIPQGPAPIADIGDEFENDEDDIDFMDDVDEASSDDGEYALVAPLTLPLRTESHLDDRRVDTDSSEDSEAGNSDGEDVERVVSKRGDAVTVATASFDDDIDFMDDEDEEEAVARDNGHHDGSSVNGDVVLSLKADRDGYVFIGNVTPAGASQV